MTLWFAIVVFGRLYTVLLCDFPGHLFGVDALCTPSYRSIPVYLWVELVFYGPVMWLALYHVSADVFGDVPTDPRARHTHRRHQFIATAAIALFLYGVGVHVADTVEVFSREQAGITDGAVYDLIYFLDEGVSHYIQFVALVFVLGWFVMWDRKDRTDHPSLALFLGVAHGVERGVGIVEGEKWFIGPAVVVWMAVAVWVRRRSVGAGAFDEFFVRYGIAFLFVLPIGQALFFLWFGSFGAPSGLSEGEYEQLGIGMVILVAVGTMIALIIDRMLSNLAADCPARLNG